MSVAMFSLEIEILFLEHSSRTFVYQSVYLDAPERPELAWERTFVTTKVIFVVGHF